MTVSLPASRTARLRRMYVLPVAGALAATALTACGGLSARGTLGADQQILASCERGAPPASMVEDDGTGSSNADSITTERMSVIRSVVRKTAICGGQLRVIVFSSSSTATVVLFDGTLHLDGATANARLRRVPHLVSGVMAQIAAAYGPAVAGLDRGGSDITAQFRLAGEWIAQLGGAYRLHLYLLSDGFQNVGVRLDDGRALSKVDAITLANRVDVPNLQRASVVVAGLGHVAGPPPASNVVEGLVAYYEALCHRTHAAQCLAVSDDAQATT